MWCVMKGLHYTHTHTCTHTHTHTHVHTHVHTPDSSLLCMSLPKAHIRELPSTEVIMPQAVISVSLVHVLSKQARRIEFRCLQPSAFPILSKALSGKMPWWNRSRAMELASISNMNRSRYSLRISSAASMEWDHSKISWYDTITKQFVTD